MAEVEAVAKAVEEELSGSIGEVEDDESEERKIE